MQWEIFLDAFEEERRWYLAREREGGRRGRYIGDTSV
jgi:hypothetical protein